MTLRAGNAREKNGTAPPGTQQPIRVLAVDDQEDVLRLIEVILSSEGFVVITAANGADALRLTRDEHPDVVLLDLMMPDLDGVEVCRRIRSVHGGSGVSVIFVTSMAASKDLIRGLDAGADDYIVKPFDPYELVARINATVRRASEMSALNPLTGLPGNVQIEREIRHRLDLDAPLALLYCDLDRFKAFNDRYGFLRGDRVIEFTADVLSQASNASLDSFVGHIGGDDFIVITTAKGAEAMARRAIASFDQGIARFYDGSDRKRGGIVMDDRSGKPGFHPLVSLSIGVATNRHRIIRDYRSLISLATEMKGVAKVRGGRTFAMDERRDKQTLLDLEISGDADELLRHDPSIH